VHLRLPLARLRVGEGGAFWCGAVMSDPCKKPSKCPRKNASTGDGGTPYFADLGGSALGFYTPQDMLEALLDYRGSVARVRAVRPRMASGSDSRPRDALRPPAAAAPRLVADDALAAGGSLPPDASLGAKALLPKAPPLSGGQDFSVGTLVGHLQDAVMVGLGLMPLDVRSSRSKAALVRPVFGGRGVFYAHGIEAFVAWAAAKDGVVGCYCSCGGDDLKENVGARVRTGVSSSCSHALALLLALQAVARHVMCTSVPELLRRHQAVDGGRVSATDVQAEPVFEGADGRAAHVVAYNRILCVVQTPPTLAKQRRPVCRHVPCRTRNVRCVHSLAVKPSAAGYGAFDDEPGVDEDAVGAENVNRDGDMADAASGDEGATAEGGLGGAPGDDSAEGDGSNEQGQQGQAPAAPPPLPRGTRRPKKGDPRVFADTDRMRRARNLLPCATETAKCARYDAIARGQVMPEGNDVKLYEERCVHCGHAIGELQAAKEAVLHTLSGRVAVVTHDGVCSNENCGKVVPFDGAHLGLFQYSARTVYTRTFLDVILFTIIATKSSISAASATSAFQLHCTGAIFDGDSAKSRQDLGRATDEYSRTLIVPRNLYKCSTCYGCSQTPYAAVVADGQTIGIFRDASHPFDRVTQNVPTIPISIDNACSVAAAKVRKCIRQRLKAGFGEEVTYVKADQQAISKFSIGSGTLPPLGDHASAGHRTATAAWAASCFWNSFFQLSSVPRDPNGGVSPPASEPPASPRSGGPPPLTPPPDLTAASPLTAIDGDARSTLQGGGPTTRQAPASVQYEEYKYCNVIPSTLGSAELLPIVRRERWAIMYAFFRTFLCEPVIGVFAGGSLDDLTKLAEALIDGKLSRDWMPLAHCVESIHVVWPMLDLLATDMDGDPEMCRAAGELLMFSIHTDLHMENLWRAEMSADALTYEAEWTDTDAAKFRAWLARQPPRPGRRPSGLVAVQASQDRAGAQADEVLSGIVFPDLEQVRAHPADAVAAAAASAAREKAKLNPKKTSKRKRADMEDGGLGDDDCRHAFLTHSTFTPGVVSYLCSCGILIGFEVLESAESPAGIVAALTARFPRLPATIYFDTACQAARNATRRVPWLVRLSKTAWALDRFHASAHKCSPLFDANNYPERSGMHKTSAAENRHSLNKPLKNHLTYLGQDRFVVQMRLIGAINNLLILYRRAIGRSDVRHRPLPLFFHALVASVCERVGCDCRPTEQ